MKIKIEGLDCPNCAKTLENHINKIDGVYNAKINFLKSYIEFQSNDNEKAINDIIEITKKIEPEAKIVTNKTKVKFNKKWLLELLILSIGIIVGVCCFVIDLPTWAYWTLLIVSVLILGYKTFYKAIQLIFKGVINENLLITISVFGAIVIGEHTEGQMVIALYSIGKILESFALNKSKKSIEELTNFKPEYATLLKGDEEIRVFPSEVNINDIIIVKPGERVPVDGIVVEGKASLDLQSLTGESLPTTVDVDNEILSGAIVLDGVLKIKATKKYEESTVNTIINLIETATEKKSKTETFISKIMKWYTLGVIILAVSVWAIIWSITKNFDLALYRGLIFLVVSCPCAFAISVPLSYFCGLGNASKNGILIKGSNYLDACAKLNLIAFDKTGTLTTGNFEITKIESFTKNYNEEDIIYIASIGEQYSLHPLAISITNANAKTLEKALDVKEIAGQGVYYTYKNKPYFVGKKSEHINKTVVELFEDNLKIGQITLKDSVKQNSKNTCEILKLLNIKSVMLSGDNKETVEDVANEIGIDEAYYKLLPQDKFEWIKLNKDNYKIGYVGDGLNDAPSLTLADVGFSMGLKGISASIEASDIVISNDNPAKIPQAIKISKQTRKIVWENIILSAVVKITFLTLGACGVTGMLSAVIADVGVTLIAILNSLRALIYKHKYKKINKSK
ncbi:MAG: cadmium-translocating P-type ATPase [Firmicutes bacterium]|nr:cadmium-translocating P-type ATPase [Bacillota bacterium]MDY5585795.1 heavy metal translocating P-type ATPase [Eubacteriales bacterium]